MKTITEYLEAESKVKCIGKTKDNRHIQIRKGSKLYEVFLYRRRFVMPHEAQNDEELYRYIKDIVLKHVYWIFSLDLDDKEYEKDQENIRKYSDKTITYTPDDWFKKTKGWIDFYNKDLQVFSDEDTKYLYDNIGEDYYKNRNMYPSFFDFKKLYNMRDTKII